MRLKKRIFRTEWSNFAFKSQRLICEKAVTDSRHYARCKYFMRESYMFFFEICQKIGYSV